MKNKIVLAVIFILGLGVSGGIGAVIGAKYFLRVAVDTNVTALNSNLAVIKLIKINKHEEAEELLENILDHYVSQLGEQANDELYAKNRDSIIEAIHKAKTYRTRTNSKHTPEPSLQKGVDAAFRL